MEETEQAQRDQGLNVVIDIESRLLKLGVKKKVLCTMARIKPEMLSYVFKRARNGQSLPEECLGKIHSALERMEQRAAKKRA